MYCKNCGKLQPDSASFCPFCGKKTDKPEEVLSTVPISEAGIFPQDEDILESSDESKNMETEGNARWEEGMLPYSQPALILAPERGTSSITPKKKFPRWLLFILCGLALLAVVSIIIFLSSAKPGNTSGIAASPISSPRNIVLGQNGLPAVNDSKFSWPQPGKDEKLFIGSAGFDSAERFYIAFVLSSDSGTIHDVVIRVENLKLNVQQGNTGISISGTTVTERYSGVYKPGPESDITLGKSKLSRLTINTDGAYGYIDYTYTYRGSGTSNTQSIPLGSSSIEFKNYTSVASTAKPSVTPVAEAPAYSNVAELLISLNSYTDTTEFEAAYARGMDYIKANGLEDKWKNLCMGVSAYMDYMKNGALYNTIKNYALESFKLTDRYPELTKVKSMLDKNTFREDLYKHIYSPENRLDLPAALWTKSNIAKYLPSKQVAIDPDDPAIQARFLAIFGEDIRILHNEYVAAAYNGDFEDFLCQKLNIRKQEFYAIMQVETAATDNKFSLSPGDPQPLTVLFIDASEKIGVNNSKEGFYSVSEETSYSSVVSRARKVYDAIREVSGDKIIFTGDPELADIIMTMDVTYPFKGTYIAGTKKASVYGCAVTVGAYRVGAPKKVAAFSAKNMPGNTISGSGSIIWMSFPALEDNADVKSFVKDILSWYE